MAESTESTTSGFEADDYTPSSEVEQLHGFYHHGSDDFDPGNNDYAVSVGGFWIATVIIGVFFILFVWVINICSCFKCFQNNCIKCCPFSGKRGKVGIVVLLFLSAAVITGSYSGYTKLVDASEGLGGVLSDLADIFENMEERTLELTRQEYEYTDGVTEANCSEVAGVEDGTAPLGKAASAMNNLVDGIAEQIRSKSELMTDTLPENLGMGIMFIVMAYWLLALFGLIAAMTKCTVDDKLLLIFSSIVLLGFIVFLGFELMFAVSIADFCYAGPATAIEKSADSAGLDATNLQLITYYTRCEGTNPFMNGVTNVTDTLDTMNDTLATAIEANNVAISLTGEAVCQTAGLTSIQGTIGDTKASITGLTDLFSCATITPLFTRAMHQYICEDFVAGLGALWVVQIIATVFLWLALAGFPCATSKFTKDEPIAPEDTGLELEDAELNKEKIKLSEEQNV